MKLRDVFINGLWSENPTFKLVLGMCPTIAVTTTVMNGLGMGIATTFVLVGSNLFVSLLRNFIPDKIRIPAFVVVIATFVTIVDLMMKAYVPALNESLGLFIPLIVVNCIILARAEAFASQNGPLASAVDGLSMGIGFTFALTIVSSIREIIGQGSLLGFQLFGEAFQPALMIMLAPGGFLALGFTMAAVNMISNRSKKKALEKGDDE